MAYLKAWKFCIIWGNHIIMLTYLTNWEWAPSMHHACLLSSRRSQLRTLHSLAVTNWVHLWWGFHLPVMNLGWPLPSKVPLDISWNNVDQLHNWAQRSFRINFVGQNTNHTLGDDSPTSNRRKWLSTTDIIRDPSVGWKVDTFTSFPYWAVSRSHKHSRGWFEEWCVPFPPSTSLSVWSSTPGGGSRHMLDFITHVLSSESREEVSIEICSKHNIFNKKFIKREKI